MSEETIQDQAICEVLYFGRHYDVHIKEFPGRALSPP